MHRADRVRWFQQLAERGGVTLDPAFNLLLELKVADERVARIKRAVGRYIWACFGEAGDPPSEEAMVERLNRDVDRLANRTPNGILMPKQEFSAEFNEVHRAVAEWYRSLRIDHLMDYIFCPVTVRVMKGVEDATVNARPYASTKLHVDLWSGDPADNVNMILPILGDLENTSVEFYHPPEDFEDRYLRVLTDYAEASELADRCARYPIRVKFGHAYFIDAVVLHKTIRGGGGVRVSIQCALRRPLSEKDRQRVEALAKPGRTNHYVKPSEWFSYGVTKFMRFKDTQADALRGVFTDRPYDQPSFDIVECLEDAAT